MQYRFPSTLSWQGKYKSNTPWYAYEVAEGIWKYSSHPFETSTLEGGGWLTPLSSRFTPGKTSLPIVQEASISILYIFYLSWPQTRAIYHSKILSLRWEHRVNIHIVAWVTVHAAWCVLCASAFLRTMSLMFNATYTAYGATSYVDWDPGWLLAWAIGSFPCV